MLERLFILMMRIVRAALRRLDTSTPTDERLEPGERPDGLPGLSSIAEDPHANIPSQSLRDGLTHLPTLDHISEILQELLPRSRNEGQPVAVCLVEITQLQEIIACLGHAAGEHMLWEVARRLTERNIVERVARVATERFLIVREGKNAEQAYRLASAIAEQLGAPCYYSGISLHIASRIGVAVFPADGALPSELLQRAELALYRARRCGTTVGVFVQADDEARERCMASLGELQHAISSDRLELYYQPKVDISDGCVVGCEALLRWFHPAKGLIPPGEFIVHAERTGMIRSMTAWVMSSALKQLRSWQDAGLQLDMAINVAGSDLADPGFVECVSLLLMHTGADASKVVLEVTESAAMKDVDNALRTMEALRIFGIRFAIDDFGTGHSSLTDLKRLPVDEIKIDRALIEQFEAKPDDDLIVRTTIDLGHALGLKVLAEGVEQAACLDGLARLGCDLIQGHIVSSPMPESEFTGWIVKRATAVGADPASERHAAKLSSRRSRSVSA